MEHITPEGRLLSFMSTVRVQPTSSTTLPDGSATAFYKATGDRVIQVFFGSGGQDGWSIIGEHADMTFDGRIEALNTSILR